MRTILSHRSGFSSPISSWERSGKGNPSFLWHTEASCAFCFLLFHPPSFRVLIQPTARSPQTGHLGSEAGRTTDPMTEGEFWARWAYWGRMSAQSGALPGGAGVKNPSANQETQETQVQSLGWEDPLEEGMSTHSGILFFLMKTLKL